MTLDKDDQPTWFKFIPPAGRTTILNIITAACRPQNIHRIAQSIEPLRSLFRVQWLLILDERVASEPWPTTSDDLVRRAPGTVGGYTQKNLGLMLADAGWVWFLDDDNLPHPEFGPLLHQLLRSCRAQGYVFNCTLDDGRELLARPENVFPGSIDQAQYVLHTDLIGGRKFDEIDYMADGRFIADVYHSAPNQVAFIPAFVTWRNRLRMGGTR